ncbi:MAG: response regulator, partial [Rhodothermales bacterium]
MGEAPVGILLVEDEEAHAVLIRRAFEAADRPVRLVVARTLQEAHRHLDERIPDLAIVDFRLPDGTGLEILPSESDEPRYPVI